MVNATRRLVRSMLLVVVVTAIVFVVGMRRKSPSVRLAVRRISRATRGFTIGHAGEPGAYASLVRHVGRTTRRSYETPVRATATDDGLVITLPYGSDTDWVKNVMKAGSATVVHEGSTLEVGRPELVSAAAGAPFFSARDQRVQRLFGVDEYLRVRRIDV